ncbi:MAG: hypothetical protein ACK50E_03560, partial [Bacteroidota bacterium]
MHILKFGGTSMGSAAAMKQVAGIVQQTAKPAMIVVSAMSGITDLLIKCSEKSAAGDESFRELLREI